jgi:(1->4)-alpha-D-glucan 1-alpha-D-glucosylmutase
LGQQGPPTLPAVPRATYRLQLGPDLRFADVAALAPYLRRLGISHAYLSPVLQAAPGSAHGYDAVDPSRVSEELGGEQGLRDAAAALAAEGLGVVVDVVPNHLAIPVPEHLNRPFWSLLADGPQSPYADWFDVHWSPEGQLLLPVLGRPLADVLDAGELALHAGGGPDGEAVLRYFDHDFPVRAGTADLPLPELVAAQHYRLAAWQRANDDVNYRRFFDVDTLVGIRVERPEVFAATHATLLRLYDEGVVHGFRIDHVDGLADPRAYLDRLAGSDDSGDSAGRWTVVEKILLGDEDLPADWNVDGTTGYDALRRIDALFVRPEGALRLREGFAAASGEHRSWTEVEQDARRYVLTALLGAEVDRLAALVLEICAEDPAAGRAEPSSRGVVDAIVELLVHLPVYRFYVVPGEEAGAAAVAGWAAVARAATTHLPHRAEDIELVRGLAVAEYGRSPRKDELVRRLQQTCGPAVAKGVEDTASYRWAPLSSLNEVGAEPDSLGLAPDELHVWATARATRWPSTMNALSTHDTKRSEDVRARITALSEASDRWLALVEGWSQRLLDTPGLATGPDAVRSTVLWQALWGAWPIDAPRLTAYLRKAAREAKQHTSWLAPDEAYEKGLDVLAEAALADPGVRADVRALQRELAPAVVANTLGARLLHLMLPGLPDVYQGAETVFARLVDPDNRVTPDWAALGSCLDTALGACPDPATDLAAAKMRLTAVGLATRADFPDSLGPGSAYLPLTPTGQAATHAVGLLRAPAPDPGTAEVAATLTRWATSLADGGGWRGTRLDLPAGRWVDRLTGTEHQVGDCGAALDDLHRSWPVALLVRTG